MKLLKDTLLNATRKTRKLFRGLFLLALLSVVLANSSFITTNFISPSYADQAGGRIVVRGKDLIDSSTNQKFTVRSNQYINVVYMDANGIRYNHYVPGAKPVVITFSPTVVPATFHQDLQNNFSQMRAMGYNTVRFVFSSYLDGSYGSSVFCKEGQPYNFSDCINSPTMKNLAESINYAKFNGLKVILSFGDKPNNYFTNGEGQYTLSSNNLLFLDPQVVKDMGRYYKDFFTYLKNTPAFDPATNTNKNFDFSSILAVEPIAEPALDSSSYPFNQPGLVMDSSRFNVASGQSFTVNDSLTAKVNGQSSSLMKQLLTQSMTQTFNYWFSQIKSVDSGLLGFYDQFPSYAVRGESRQVNDALLLDSGLQADIVATQLYPDYLSSPTTDNLNTFFQDEPGYQTALANIQKPFVVIEFGLRRDIQTILQQTSPDNDLTYLKNWQDSMCQLAPSGWSLFYWNAPTSADFGGTGGFVSALADNNRLAYNLSPAVRHNLCDNPPPSGSGASVAVFRPTTAEWFLKNSGSSGNADATFTFGMPGDIPIVGDWTGKGYKSVGVYRNGAFYLKNSNSSGNADMVITFGQPGDLPVVGDWDGNGTDTIGVFRNGTFLLKNSNSAGFAELQFQLGIEGDVPIAGKWNGGSVTTVGVFRPSTGEIFLKNSNSSGIADTTITYGLPNDKPLTGDFDGNGTDTIGVYRGNTFYLKNSNASGFADLTFSFGNPGDIPLAGKWGRLGGQADINPDSGQPTPTPTPQVVPTPTPTLVPTDTPIPTPTDTPTPTPSPTPTPVDQNPTPTPTPTPQSPPSQTSELLPPTITSVGSGCDGANSYIDLSWQPSPTTQIAWYHVYRQISGEDWKYVGSASGDQTTFRDSAGFGLLNNTTYNYKMTAEQFSNTGPTSDYSNAVTPTSPSCQ